MAGKNKYFHNLDESREVTFVSLTFLSLT